MSELTKEQFEQLPEFIQGDYEQVGDVYKHAGMMKVKKTADDLDSKLKDTNQRLTEFEKNQQEQMAKREQELAEKHQQELESLKKSGNFDEFKKQLEARQEQEKKDLAERARKEGYDQATSEQRANQAKKDASYEADTLGQMLGADPDAGLSVADLIRNRIEIDPDTGKKTYFDAKGSALSVDRNGFINELKKEARLKRLLKAEVVTIGGGGANGSGGGGAVISKFNEMTGSELSALRKENPAEYERLKSEYYSNS
jgi:hypothetical protein